MKEFERILFPVDFSDVSPKIAPWVHRVAEKYDASVHLLFVARMIYYFTDMYVDAGSIEVLHGEVIQGAERKMDEFIQAHFKEYPNVKAKVVLGDPAEEILRYTEAENIDLVIMGTHGRKGLERIIFGSVAERVITMSPVPVLSINPYRIGKDHE
ncbi:MAG: universal stress protein [Deltaproteobacteria bacterium]|nr:universal stress protein [Deltaproteobacteria bacterium]